MNIKKFLESRINLSGFYFFIWLSIALIIAKTPMPGDLIYWKVTWLFITVGILGFWGYIWDKESDKKLEELESTSNKEEVF